MNHVTEDPLLTNARREAVIVAGVWLAAVTYTVGYCALFGYVPADQRELKLIFGFPDWVLWGIVAPWVTCVVIGIWFSYFYMADDDVNAGVPPDSSSQGDEL